VCGAAITTASDLYSLGVLLFEMLTGARPYRETAGPLELAKAIAEEDPETLGSKTGRRFDEDLENILKKALRKEPERRYASADQFAEDIQRYLDGYTVGARADTAGYRVRKFVGRNKVAVGAAAVLFCGSVA